MGDRLRYLTATAPRQGALAIFLVFGEEEALSRLLDARVGKRAGGDSPNTLSVKELRYGWLRTQGGRILDEVMLACPGPGRRVLMTHGGRVVREQVEGYFQEAGVRPLPEDFPRGGGHAEPLLHPLLASCVTEGQVAAVLAADAGEGDATRLAHVLAPRRVVLAGAPNAGKSSLLNALAGYGRAFVDREAGATRDVVDELVDLAGWAVWMGDMPGYGGGERRGDLVEAEAWRRASVRLRLAESVWFVADGSEPWGAAADSAAAAVAELLSQKGDTKESKKTPSVLVIVNKADCPRRLSGEPWRTHFPAARALVLSSLPSGDALEVVESYVAGAWTG